MRAGVIHKEHTLFSLLPKVAIQFFNYLDKYVACHPALLLLVEVTVLLGVEVRILFTFLFKTVRPCRSPNAHKFYKVRSRHVYAEPYCYPNFVFLKALHLLGHDRSIGL